jgi:hypothetical protein
MLLRDSKSTAIFAYPAIATAAVTLFLLRNRPIADGSSPGSGVTIAVSEVLSRLPDVAHWAIVTSDRALSLLFHAAAAPANLALATMEAEFRFAISAIGSLSSVFHALTAHLLHL